MTNHNSVSKTDILNATQNGLTIFQHYLPDVQLPTRKNFRSPFYDDTRASCNVFQGRDAIWRFKDFGDGDVNQSGGDAFWFVATLKGFNLTSDFPKVLEAIISDLGLPLSQPLSGSHSYLQPTKTARPTASKPKSAGSIQTTPFEYSKKEYSLEELSFWGHYGITPSILRQYNVLSLHRFSSVNRKQKPYTICSSPAEPMFFYKITGGGKVYRPFSSVRFLNTGSRSDNVAFGLDQLPLKGDIVFITGGEKDVLSLATRGFNAIAFNSETASISREMIEMLKRRFKHVVFCYDTDDTGLKASAGLTAQFSEEKVLNLRLPLTGSKTDKDISDYFASGKTREDLLALITELLETELYAQTMVLLRSCEIDPSNPPDLSETVIRLENTTLGSYDNLLCIVGGEGSGKSNYVSAIISGAISPYALPAKQTLGVTVAPNPLGKAVIHYDTEQSDAQLYKNVMRSIARAGMSKKPKYYHSLCLTSFSRKERLRLIQDSMDMYHHRYGGIHLVVLDGIADLIRSANDEIESIAIVEEIYRLAGIYNTCIICVLHFTPSGSKPRGHIGSELQRKSAGIISLEKDKDDPTLSVVKALKVRDGEPLDVSMMTFGWSKEQDMHVYKGVKTMEEKEARKYNELSRLAKETFQKVESMSLKEFEQIVQEDQGIKDRRTIARRIAYMLEHKIISQSEDNIISLNKNNR